jgi:hypothetical protein
MHQSVKDYLVAQEFTRNADAPGNLFRVKQNVVHAELARTCMTHIQEASQTDSIMVEGYRWNFHLIPALEESFPFLSYSIFNWPTHARLSEQDIFGDNDLFFAEISEPWDAWLNAHWRFRGRYIEPPQMFSLLHVAAFFDLPLLVTRLLDGHFSGLDAKDTHDRTPLWYAVDTGSKGIVSLLLKMGVAVNGENDLGQTALWMAAARGHNDVVEMLLEKGADIDARNKSGQTPLWQAAAIGFETTVKLQSISCSKVQVHSQPPSLFSYPFLHQTSLLMWDFRYLNLYLCSWPVY